MKGQGRHEKLKTVENLVILILHDPNQTRKEIMDKMTGKTQKGISDDNRPADLKGITRQSVYKALDFLKESGILIEKSNEIVFKINKRTIKSITISIDMEEVKNRYEKLWLEQFTHSEQYRILPDEAKKIVLESMNKRFKLNDMIDAQEEAMLLNLNSKDSSIREYLHLQNVDTVMEYLKMFYELKN